MRLTFLMSMLFAARAGQPAALNRPLEYMHHGRSRQGTGRGRALREWHSDRAARALALVDVAHAATRARRRLLEIDRDPVRELSLSGKEEAELSDDVAIWRRLRNQRKARRQRIRAQGGQA